VKRKKRGKPILAHFRVVARVDKAQATPAKLSINRVAGYEADLDKYNAAAEAGWQVLRFTATHVRSGSGIRKIEDALKAAAERR
jgi:hypothetical protein